LEGSDESCFQKASKHLKEVGGIQVDERQIQRVINRIGDSANQWQRRETVPEPVDPGILYISADATGVPMRKEELVGRKHQNLRCAGVEMGVTSVKLVGSTGTRAAPVWKME